MLKGHTVTNNVTFQHFVSEMHRLFQTVCTLNPSAEEFRQQKGMPASIHLAKISFAVCLEWLLRYNFKYAFLQ